MKLGSLFDGIGGFPMVASWHGITPVWASEIEPACVSITRRHFPHMKHLGDVSRINGADIEPVDIVTFGSPCTDLSVAGKRAGLAGAESGLFYEAIRIINEMRTVTNGSYPTWVIWENVPGALSSSNGLDFRAVLQSFTGTEIPMPRSKRWAGAGMVGGGRCDLAWRILDAQFWGVPQRRRRVFLVADFGGQRSAQLCFEPEGLRGNFAPGEAPWKRFAGYTGNGLEEANGNGPKYLTSWDSQSKRIISSKGVSPTLTGADGGGGRNCAGYILCEDCGPGPANDNGTGRPRAASVYDARGNGDGETVNTLTGYHQSRVTDYTALLRCAHGQGGFDNCIVRRLTVLECERLQGLPDGWTALGHDGKPISNTKRYAAIGNSVALPCVDYIISGIVAATTDKVGKGESNRFSNKLSIVI